MNFISQTIGGIRDWWSGGASTSESASSGSATRADTSSTNKRGRTGSKAKSSSAPSDAQALSLPSSPPVLVDVKSNGGVQGLGWYAAKQKQDEHGDLADEFYFEELGTEPHAPLVAKKMKGARQKALKVKVEDVKEGNVVLRHAQ